ncbi:MAG: DNA repair protein RecO [Porticoccaceae bacterium]
MTIVRIEAEPGFVLHQTPYRETSLLVDLYSRHYGRVRCVAKGFRKPNKKGISRAIFPYTEHYFSWQGNGDLKTLTRADAIQAPIFLQREALFTGLYINELLYRLMHEYDPHPYFYAHYQQFIAQLAERGANEAMLRTVEMSLLEELGYGLVLHVDSQGLAIDANQFYQYVPEHGLTPVGNSQDPNALFGRDLIALVNNDFSQASVMRAAKQINRRVIDFYLGGRPLNSRELYRQHIMSADNHPSAVE